MKKNQAWCVVNKCGCPLLHTMAFTRRESISGFLSNHWHRHTWRVYRRDGYRCVKVNITEVSK